MTARFRIGGLAAIVSVGAVLAGLAVAGFAAGRATVGRPVAPDPVRAVGGVPVGVVDTGAGALAAADNYVAGGIVASLDSGRLASFATAVLAPSARSRFLEADGQLTQELNVPVGTRALGIVVADRLEWFSRAGARASVWELGELWSGSARPSQYSAVVQLALEWRAGRWWIASLSERVPGPVPVLVASPDAARTNANWNAALTGMSPPDYGDGVS